MKTITSILFLLIITFSFLACDDSFSPKGEFQDGYTLYCVIDGNSSHQEAYLFKNYNPDGFDATDYNKDRTVPNAVIKLSDGVTEYTFKDTSEFKESLGYSVNYYKLDNFKINNYQNQLFDITAVTEDGKTISGKTFVDVKSVHFLPTTRKELPYEVMDSLVVLFGDNTSFQFAPFLILNYIKIVNGDTTFYHKEIPTGFVNEGGIKLPIYPEYKLRNIYRYSIAVIANVVKEIAKDKHPADRIKILDLTLGVLQVTNPLDTYYKTYRSNSDGFSIKTQEPNITNIKNGNGIFAYKSSTSVNILFRRDWNNFFASNALEQR